MSTPSQRPLPDLWMLRTPNRVRVVRRKGAEFIGARAPWLRGHLELLRMFVVNDFRARYRAQALGVVWSLLQPLVMMGILSIVFTKAFRSTEPRFPVFLLLGLLVWQWFAAAMNAATLSFVGNADMVKRTVFPRALLPIGNVLSLGINAAIESLALLVIVPFFPGALQIGWALVAIVPLIVALVFVLIGAALAISVLNVIYRDIAYLVSTGLALLYWLTPIVYPPQFLPEPWRSMFAWNPLSGVISGLRDVVLHGHAPGLHDWARLGFVSFGTLALGAIVFRIKEREMLDHV